MCLGEGFNTMHKMNDGTKRDGRSSSPDYDGNDS